MRGIGFSFFLVVFLLFEQSVCAKTGFELSVPKGVQLVFKQAKLAHYRQSQQVDVPFEDGKYIFLAKDEQTTEIELVYGNERLCVLVVGQSYGAFSLEIVGEKLSLNGQQAAPVFFANVLSKSVFDASVLQMDLNHFKKYALKWKKELTNQINAGHFSSEESFLLTNWLNYRWANEVFLAADQVPAFSADQSFFAFLDKITLDQAEMAFSVEYMRFLRNFLLFKTRAKANYEGFESMQMYSLASKWLSGLVRFRQQAVILLDADLSEKPGLWVCAQDFIDSFNKTYLSGNQILSSQIEQIAIMPIGQYYFESNKQALDWQIFLQKYQGSVVYLDIWASWCQPCLKESTFLPTLQEAFAGKPVTFLFVSFDTDVMTWKNAVIKHHLKGYHLGSSESLTDLLTKKYKITVLPRYLIFDKNGVLQHDNAPRPSNTEELKELINNLLEN